MIATVITRPQPVTLARPAIQSIRSSPYIGILYIGILSLAQKRRSASGQSRGSPAAAMRREACGHKGVAELRTRNHRNASKHGQRPSQNQLGLGYQCDELSFFRFQARLPDLCPASAMKRRSSGNDRRALVARAEEIRLALDRGCAIGACRKVYECRRATGRVRQRHGTAAMHSMT